MATNHPEASWCCACLCRGTGSATRSTSAAVQMETGDCHFKTFLHEAQARWGIFPGLIYSLYTFLLFMLFVLISFKKQIWENEVGCELGAGRCSCSRSICEHPCPSLGT